MNRHQLVQYISHVLPMSLERANQIAMYFEPVDIRKNDCLLPEGIICNVAYFLEEGFCRAFTHDTDNNDVTTALFANGLFANDFVSFFRQAPSQETIQALTDCRAWAISYQNVQLCFHSIPEFREFGRMMLINNYALLKHRMLSMIQQTAEQRYAHLMASNPAVFQHVPLKYIATYLGITDTSLSRIRKEFSRK